MDSNSINYNYNKNNPPVIKKGYIVELTDLNPSGGDAHLYPVTRAEDSVYTSGKGTYLETNETVSKNLQNLDDEIAKIWRHIRSCPHC